MAYIVMASGLPLANHGPLPALCNVRFSRAYIVIAHTVMVYIGMANVRFCRAYIVMVYIVMVYVVMLDVRFSWDSLRLCAREGQTCPPQPPLGRLCCGSYL